MNIKSPIVVVCTFLWIGFVVAISFLEAPLKFQAPDITLALGLGIGRLVFAALNKVEWVFALMITFSLFCRGNFTLKSNLTFILPLLILLIQTLWLLPALDTRAELHIRGAVVPDSFLHFYYVAAEVAKVTCLLVFGVGLFHKPIPEFELSTPHAKQTV
ncbi:hypothetical protein [Salmonirosea aquatica]|uniref:DUF4149 domain-containing protein n=1 Tax=Salmonirosea aquatica TaxID=2654236 RepID=A0A7C9FN08_9BACT|nr:hypothetical protein [Cytophagaceae bacterium SJW1-29]